MSKQGVLVEALDAEAQFLWTASGNSIVGKSSDLWCAYTGQQETEAQDWGWVAMLHSDDRERARHLWLLAAEHKQFYETWYRIRNARGVYHTFLLRCMPVLHDDGALKEWICQLSPATAERLLLEPDSLQTNLLYHLFVEQASIGMAYISIDGRFFHANDQFCSLVGYSREELIGRRFADITHPDDIALSDAFVNVHLTGTPTPSVLEKRYIRKDGAIVWAKVTAMLLRLPSAEPLCFFSLIEDITERKRVEEEQEWLLQFERAAGDAERREKYEVSALVDQLKAVFEAMTDGVVFCDVEGKILLMNAAGYKLMGLGSEVDMIGEEVYPQITFLYKVYNEYGEPLSIEQIPLSRILHGEVVSSEQSVDVIMRLPSGREARLATSGAPVYDRRGHQIGGVCVFRDVTEARQKERRVQQALDALLTIVEEVSHLPIQADEPTEVVPVPPLYTIGHKLTEIIRQVLQCHYVACISIEPQTSSQPDKLHFVGVSGLSTKEEQIYRKEVEQSFLSDYYEPEVIERFRANEVVIRDLVTRPFVQPRTDFGIRYRLIAPMLLDGQLLGLLAIGAIGADVNYTQEDIALVKAIAKVVLQVIERVRLLNEWTVARANELALREANRRFDAFLSIASHELRTPLTTIKGNVQLALRRMETLKSQCDQLMARPDSYEQIMRGLERVHSPLLQASHRTRVQERMISDLLDASRIRANKLELLMRPCDLVQIVRQMVEDLHHFASDRPVQMHLPENRSVPLMADADRIGQVVNNYLVNALRYSSPDSSVEITLELIEGGKMARVSVRDEGVGIASEDLKHIWERFYRSHATATQYNAGAGLGLGLYISRTIIERHGGRVGVESIPGKGSTFWFTLPLAEA